MATLLSYFTLPYLLSFVEVINAYVFLTIQYTVYSICLFKEVSSEQPLPVQLTVILSRYTYHTYTNQSVSASGQDRRSTVLIPPSKIIYLPVYWAVST